MPSSIGSASTDATISLSESSELIADRHKPELYPPIVIGQLDPKPSRKILSSTPVKSLKENGKVAVDARGKRIKDLPVLPRHLPSVLKAMKLANPFLASRNID